MQIPNPYSYIRDLPQNRAEISDQRAERALAFPTPRPPRDLPTRPSHLKARRYPPVHPLLKIARKLPQKLTPAQFEGLPHDELARRFMLSTSKFKWSRRSVWS